MPNPKRLFDDVELTEPYPTGNQLREILVNAVRDEVEKAAKIADDMGHRLSRSGKDDEAMVAIEIAAKIRNGKPV